MKRGGCHPKLTVIDQAAIEGALLRLAAGKEKLILRGTNSDRARVSSRSSKLTGFTDISPGGYSGSRPSLAKSLEVVSPIPGSLGELVLNSFLPACWSLSSPLRWKITIRSQSAP